MSALSHINYSLFWVHYYINLDNQMFSKVSISSVISTLIAGLVLNVKSLGGFNWKYRRLCSIRVQGFLTDNTQLRLASPTHHTLITPDSLVRDRIEFCVEFGRRTFYRTVYICAEITNRFDMEPETKRHLMWFDEIRPSFIMFESPQERFDHDKPCWGKQIMLSRNSRKRTSI